jgi:uncharacterized damage-inducible protein DinB
LSGVRERIGRLFRYDEWANGETLASLEAVANPPERALQIFAHIVGAELLWHARLTRRKTPQVWPRWTLSECRTRLDELSGLWRSYLGDLTDERLRDTVAYVNSKGEPWMSAVEDILTHVVLHSAHHRGQIASGLREAGHTPAYTDYIHAVRQGLLK